MAVRAGLERTMVTQTCYMTDSVRYFPSADAAPNPTYLENNCHVMRSLGSILGNESFGMKTESIVCC